MLVSTWATRYPSRRTGRAPGRSFAPPRAALAAPSSAQDDSNRATGRRRCSTAIRQALFTSRADPLPHLGGESVPGGLDLGHGVLDGPAVVDDAVGPADLLLLRWLGLDAAQGFLAVEAV